MTCQPRVRRIAAITTMVVWAVSGVVGAKIPRNIPVRTGLPAPDRPVPRDAVRRSVQPVDGRLRPWGVLQMSDATYRRLLWRRAALSRQGRGLLPCMGWIALAELGN